MRKKVVHVGKVMSFLNWACLKFFFLGGGGETVW